MISYISGKIVERGHDSVVIDHNGMGYHVFFARPELVSLNQSMVIFTYQHVREDAIVLFGFLSKEDREIFTQLISVKGVGPKTGLNILSKTSAQALIEAVEREDISMLKQLPGIGAKTASQILLDLKGKFVSAHVEAKIVVPSELEEAMDALVQLGFKRSEVGALQAQLEAESTADLRGLIRKGLQILNARKRG